MPAEFVIPNGKVQSNFTFTMASSGDPSTFNFVVDAFPAYTKFGDKKVLAVIQVIEDTDDDVEYARDETGIVEADKAKKATVEVKEDENLGG
jgi:hypothetical protein